jgi:hypothetical protein
MINEIIKRNGITYGILTGVFSAVFTATIYAVNINLFTSLWLGLSSIAFYLIISIVLLSKTKKELKGLFTFKEAFTTYFICSLIGILIGTAFNILLFNVIDSSAQDTVKELTIKSAVETMQKFNTPAAAINEAITKMKENNPYSVLGLIKGSLSSIVFSSIIGLIMAAFFKSKSQE